MFRLLMPPHCNPLSNDRASRTSHASKRIYFDASAAISSKTSIANAVPPTTCNFAPPQLKFKIQKSPIADTIVIRPFQKQRSKWSETDCPADSTPLRDDGMPPSYYPQLFTIPALLYPKPASQRRITVLPDKSPRSKPVFSGHSNCTSIRRQISSRIFLTPIT
jgi:hypothetical protein